MKEIKSEAFDWEAFSGRALAYLCIHFADKESKTLLERAEFLMANGAPSKRSRNRPWHNR